MIMLLKNYSNGHVKDARWHHEGETHVNNGNNNYN